MGEDGKFWPKGTAEFATVFIAVVALITSIWSAGETRKHNRLSFKPNLSISSSFIGSPSDDGLFLNSHGPGPALIEDFSMYIGENKLNSLTADTLLDEVRKKLNFTDFYIYITKPRSGDVLRPGDRIRLVGSGVGDRFKRLSRPQELRLQEGFKKLKFVIKYKSVYEEEYVLNHSW